MANLAEIDRVAIWQKFMALGDFPSSLTKADIKAAIDAIDAFIETNATAFNNAFPAEFKAAATAAQKAVIVGYVALKRAGLNI